MAESGVQLHKRSDGWWETADGLFAVTMRVMSAQSEDMRWFEFVTSHSQPPSRVEWHRDDKLQLFPADVAAGLVRQNYARHPDDAAVEWYEAIALVEDQPEPDPAPVPPAPAPKRKPREDPEGQAG